ncbi:Uncharacterized protein TCM_017441 [Theobroma cacao]|uniref:MULE transposase domain-containing protein n=1 Tax=Theobroma cacao TaxID=3641 RepID=A0A061EL47_THECC|nr:Uncharacterized protein TCM_017441 [Theobroma cacao]
MIVIRGSAGISRTWLILGAKRLSFQTINIDESTCADDHLYKGRMFSSKSYRACTQGFRDVMRSMVAIDATHLKGRFKGVLFVVDCKDANECIYLVAFGIGYVEDKDSWMWFLSKLHDVVGCLQNTMFISYQHLSMINYGAKKVENKAATKQGGKQDKMFLAAARIKPM